MRVLAIDFGTSNTVVALAVDGQAARTVTFDASPLLPSAVYLAADGTVTVGREALRQARLDPARFEANPKRRIDDGEVLLGDRVVGVVDLIAAVLRTVAAEVRRQLGGAAPDEVRLTHPAQWGATRQNTLLSAARAAGLGSNLVLIPEPVAAAAQYTRLPGRTLPPGGTVAVYDLGGGTFDIAVVGRTQNDFHVLAEAGLSDLGGLDFDQSVLDHVGRSSSAADPARWQQVLRPVDASTRRAARALAEDVRAAKETLSRYAQTEVALPDPFADVHVTRPEFEGLIRPNLLRSIEVLQATLRNAGLGPERLTGIFLVGGSSRIPLVAKLIQEQLGVIPVALDQPETAVALGALLVPVHREGNRTVQFGDTPSGPQLGPASGGQQFGGPRSGPVAAPLPGTGGQSPVTGGRPPLPGAGQDGPVSGRQPSAGGRPGTAGIPMVHPGLPLPAKKSRRPLIIGAAIAAVAVAGAIIVVTTTSGGGGTAGPTPPVTTSGSGSTSVASSGSQSVASSDPSSGGSSSSQGSTSGSAQGSDTPGVGPGKLFTPGEFAFLGAAADRLINCSDATSAFNKQVPAAYRGTRVVQCEVSEAEKDKGRLYGRVLVYVVTTASPQAAAAYQDQVLKDRQKGDYATADESSTQDTSLGKLRLQTAESLSQIGVMDSGEGAPVVTWALSTQKYVGMMVALRSAMTGDMVDYFRINFQPR